ncbi:MAG: hypothetical protein WCI17_07545 [bacterium]
MGIADRDYMRSDSHTPSHDEARPGLWARFRFALWLLWRRLRRRSDA